MQSRATPIANERERPADEREQAADERDQAAIGRGIAATERDFARTTVGLNAGVAQGCGCRATV